MQLRILGNNLRIGITVLANNLLMPISTTWLLVITILQKKYMEMTVEFILVKLMVLQKKYPLEILIM